MTRKITSTTRVNRKALDAIREGFVEGLEAVGQAIIAQTTPPDDPATAATIDGDYGVWVDGRKVAGTATKPRRAKVKTGITLLVGYDFPARFNEMGTVHQPARPFVTPTLLAVVPGSDRYLQLSVRKRIAGVR